MAESKRKGSLSSSQQSKRSRYDEHFDDSHGPGSFEEELALLESVERESSQSQNDSQSSVGTGGTCNELDGVNSLHWKRPKAPALNPNEDKLVFQQIDLDHYVGKFN